VEGAAKNFLVKVGVCFGAEGEATAEHGEEHDPEAPHVHWLAAVLHTVHDLRRHVTGRAAEYFESLGVFALHAEAKVDELGVARLVEEYYLQARSQVGEKARENEATRGE